MHSNPQKSFAYCWMHSMKIIMYVKIVRSPNSYARARAHAVYMCVYMCVHLYIPIIEALKETMVAITLSYTENSENYVSHFRKMSTIIRKYPNNFLRCISNGRTRNSRSNAAWRVINVYEQTKHVVACHRRLAGEIFRDRARTRTSFPKLFRTDRRSRATTGSNERCASVG